MKKFFITGCLLILISASVLYGGSNKNKDRWLSKDKFSHLTSSTFIYCWHYEVLHNGCQFDKGRSKVFAISLTEFYGLIKEIYDSKQKDNYFSFKDLIFDTLGNIAGYAIYK